jgi:hypothetical protein
MPTAEHSDAHGVLIDRGHVQLDVIEVRHFDEIDPGCNRKVLAQPEPARVGLRALCRGPRPATLEPGRRANAGVQPVGTDDPVDSAAIDDAAG